MNITPKNLRDAAELISKPGTWTKFAYAATEPVKYAGAIDAAGHDLVHDPRAKCFCMAGAVAKVIGQPAASVPERISPVFGGAWAPTFNDDPDTTQEDVVTALLLAAEVLASEEGWDEA